MRQRRLLTAAVLSCAAAAAHAEHYEYRVDLTGTYSQGGAGGCYPPDFNQPACPRAGTLTALMSFDTPGTADGSFLIEGDSGDITDFHVNLGWLAGEELYGGISVDRGAPSGSVGPLDQSETFAFDWASRSASYTYDFGDHNGYGSFLGTLSAVPEPPRLALLLAGIAFVSWRERRRAVGSRGA